MKTCLIALMLCLVGCAGSLKHVNRVGLVTSVAATACDWGQTRAAAETGWRGTFEGNRMLGPKPTTEVVDMYMAGMIVSTVIISQILPDKVRPYFYGGITAVEVNTVAGNIDTVPGVCGLGGSPVVAR